MSRRFCRASLFAAVIAVVVGTLPLQGEDLTGRFGLGMNWPGISVKYGLGPRWAVEGKFQTESNINVMGPRLYYVLKGTGNLNLFAGAEADYVTFTGDVSKGTGFAAEVFAGGEYFINRNLSFQLDMGPATVSLQDTQSSQSVSGLDVVANIGINYYFGR